MKKYVLCLFVLLLLSGCGVQKEAVPRLPWPKTETTLFVSSDLHWQENGTSERIPYLDELIDTLLDETQRDAPAALILCGDLTNGGRAEEHNEVARRLSKAEQAGVQIFVTMGNHDMDHRVATEELEKIYGEFGFDEATSHDEDSMSYLAELNEEIWFLSLDCNVYGEKKSESAGTISEKTLAWVEDCLQQARQAGVMVVPFSHHNLLEHTLEGKSSNYNINRGAELSRLLLDYGVPIYLSGHRHNSFIVPFEQGGRQLHELVTDMPGAYPYRYTALRFQRDGTITYAVPGLDVDSWAVQQGRTEEELLNFSDYSHEAAQTRTEQNAAGVAEKLTDDVSIQTEMARFYVDFYNNYQIRNLWQEGARLRADPGLALWQKYGAENIYGRWIPWILQNQCNDAPEQVLGPFR